MFARYLRRVIITLAAGATDIVAQCRHPSTAMAITPTATATRTSFRAETHCFIHCAVNF